MYYTPGELLMPAPFKWTDEQIQDMLMSYTLGESLNTIAHRYRTSYQVLSPLLKKHGLILRSHSEEMRRHTCNHSYFHDIDSEEKAYWLGFLTADGCITTGNRVTLNLAMQDCEHLYKFKRALDATQMVSENQHSCSLVICSPEMASDLAMHGILPNKTFSTRVASVPFELVRHYWRGVIDGDGFIARGKAVLTLCGDYEVVSGFQAFVLSLCPVVRAKVLKSENIYTFSLGKPATQCIVRVMYRDATVALERKQQRAQEILNV